MKKKVLSIFIAAVLVLATVFALTACNSEVKKKNDGKLVLKDGMNGGEVVVALTNANIQSVTMVYTYSERNGAKHVRTTKVNKTTNYEEEYVDDELYSIRFELYENGRYYEYSYNKDNTIPETIDVYDISDCEIDKMQIDGVAECLFSEFTADLALIYKMKGKGIDEDIDNTAFIKVENNTIFYTDENGDTYLLKDFDSTEIPLPEGMKGYDKMPANAQNLGFDKEGEDGARGTYVSAPILSVTVPEFAQVEEYDPEQGKYVSNTYKVVAVDMRGDMLEYTFTTNILTIRFDGAFNGQIVFRGTMEQFKAIEITEYSMNTITVHCTDGDVTVSRPADGE